MPFMYEDAPNLAHADRLCLYLAHVEIYHIFHHPKRCALGAIRIGTPFDACSK